MDWWKQLGNFWERSTGGKDVAARPTDDARGLWPTVPRASGIDEAIGWLRAGFVGAELPRLVFLVGGPGAGKSHAAAEVVADLHLLDDVSPLAQRTYNYSTGGRDLFVVNDATVSSSQYKHSPLTREIDDVLESQKHFLGCVNRGVLVEERSGASENSAQASAGEAIVDWLQLRPNDTGPLNRGDWSVKQSAGAAYLKAGTILHHDDEVAEVLVVYVDVNSLLERAPQVHVESVPELQLTAGRYSVTQFDERASLSSASFPAGALFAQVVANVVGPEAGAELEHDPFQANLSSFAFESVRRGYLSVLRAAEITSSQRLTFREVWGGLSRAVIGGAHTQFEPSELESFAASLQPAIADSPSEAFAKIRQLAECRFSQAIFGADDSAGTILRDPVLRLTNLSDPVRDAVPGRLADKSGPGWASSISDAFSSDSGITSPLEELVRTGDGGQAFLDAITSFDHELDSAYRRFMRDGKIKDRERQEATAWYGAYLTRLFAVSCGVPAFRKEVQMWTSAMGMSPSLPSTLDDQLTALLKPVRYPDQGGGEPLFPLFESRTNPIRGDESRPKLAIRSRNPRIRSIVESDSIFVSVEEIDREPVSMLLDFAMVREAMACASGFTGSTELSETTSPRLERFRATRLVPGERMDTSNYRVVVGSNDLPLKVDEARHG